MLLAMASLLRLSWFFLLVGTHNEGKKRPAGAVPRCIAGSAGLVLEVMQALVW